MLTHKMKIAGLERELPLCKVNDDLYIGAFVILGDPQLTTASAKALLKIAPEYDIIITAETKGITLAHEMARLNGDDYYCVARKRAKLYMTSVFEVKVNSITTEGEQHLFLDYSDVEKIRGKRVLIVDDVISTGESLNAIQTLVEKAGAITVGKMAILVEGNAQKRYDILYLEKLPLFNSDGTIKQ